MTFKAKEARKGKLKPPIKGWHRGLKREEKRWVEEWNLLDNKSAAVRIVWPEIGDSRKVAQKAWNISQRIQVQRAMSMIRGIPWDGPEKGNLDGENATADKRDKGWKTRTARLYHRNIDDLKPLDCLMETMKIHWREAESLVDRSGEEPKETSDSLAFRKEACVYAKEAAPYMHARLQSMEVREVDAYEAMSDDELTKTVVKLLKDVAGTGDMAEDIARNAAKGTGGRKPGTPPVRH